MSFAHIIYLISSVIIWLIWHTNRDFLLQYLEKDWKTERGDGVKRIYTDLWQRKWSKINWAVNGTMFWENGKQRSWAVVPDSSLGFLCTLGPSGQDNHVTVLLEEGDTKFRAMGWEGVCVQKTLNNYKIITNQISTLTSELLCERGTNFFLFEVIAVCFMYLCLFAGFVMEALPVPWL